MVIDETRALHWRAMLHRYDRQNVDTSEVNKVIRDVQERLLSGLLTVFRLTGADIPTTLRDKLNDYIVKDKVVEEASRLSETLVCGIFSTVLEVFLVSPNDTFNAQTMEDADQGQSAAITEGRVLCTTHLGVREVSYDQQGIRSVKRMLLKPRVVLDS